MRVKPSKKALLVSILVAALLFGTAISIQVLFLIKDNIRFTQIYKRDPLYGELSYEAENIPLVLALWNKALYYDGSIFEYADTVDNKDKQNIFSYYEVTPFYEDLYLAGVLPRNAESLNILPEEKIVSRIQAQSFVRYSDLLVYDNKQVIAAQVKVSSDDANAIRISDACSNYLIYLGLDTLDDWQPATFSEIDGLQRAGLYSPGAQILIQVTLDYRFAEDNIFMICGAYPITREDFALRNLS